MTYPLVRDLAADGIPVMVTCRVLGFSPQGFYEWRPSPASDQDWSDAHLVDAARDVHADDPAFGYRFIADELEAEHGITASEYQVHRLCSADSVFSVLARKKAPRPRPGEAVHDDLVQREFSAQAANALWFTDITDITSTAPTRASSTCAVSRTPSQAGSSATPWNSLEEHRPPRGGRRWGDPHAQGGSGPEIQVDGSGGLIQTLLEHDLADEFWLKMICNARAAEGATIG